MWIRNFFANFLSHSSFSACHLLLCLMPTSRRCPNPEDGTVEVVRNGLSISSIFSFRMFTFDGYPSQVYLYCSLHLCPLQDNSCTPVSLNAPSPLLTESVKNKLIKFMKYAGVGSNAEHWQ